MHDAAYFLMFGSIILYSYELLKQSMRDEFNDYCKVFRRILLFISIVGGLFTIIVKVICIWYPITWMGMGFFYT